MFDCSLGHLIVQLCDSATYNAPNIDSLAVGDWLRPYEYPECSDMLTRLNVGWSIYPRTHLEQQTLSFFRPATSCT